MELISARIANEKEKEMHYGQKPTKEQRQRIREAAGQEIVYDEDCPELSSAMLKSLHSAVRQRNRFLDNASAQ